MRWSLVNLNELIELEYGESLPEAKRDPNGRVPVLGSNGIVGYHSHGIVKGPGIVVGRKGSAGKVVWCDTDFWPIDTTYFVKFKANTDPRWAFYLLQHLSLERLAIITGVPGLNRNDAYNLKAPAVPLAEQRRIVEILDQADRLRKLRRQSDAIAERILPALFYKMFGDPVRNEKGWKKESLGEHARVQGGFAFKSDDFQMDGILLVRIGNLKDERISANGEAAYLPEHYLSEYAEYRLNAGDILIALTGATTGKLARYVQTDPPALLNQRVGRVQMKRGSMLRPDYLYFIMKSQHAQSYIWQHARGFGQPNIAPRQIQEYEIPIPPVELQAEFEAKCKQIYQIRETARDSGRLHESTFNVLLHRAFTGELTKRWREKNAALHGQQQEER
jgi:type I restriction enzyme S subunit